MTEQISRLKRLLSAVYLALAAAALIAPMTGMAQSRYPEKPVRVIVPFAPGGVTDLLGRIIATGLSERLGRPFVVENRPGASGNVGAAAVAQAEPDGHTLLLGTIATQSVNGFLFSKPGFNAVTDFAPITQAVEFPNVIGVTKNLPVKTLTEFIAHARANPGKLSYGSTGNGGSLHLVMEIMKLRYGLDGNESRTLEEVGRELEVTRERVRQIEASALGKLRKRGKSRRLRELMS